MGGQKNWKMLTFKIASLGIPYVFMDKLMESAGQQQMNLLYWQAKDRYKRYKMTGDMLQLNPYIKIVDSLLSDSSQIQK